MLQDGKARSALYFAASAPSRQNIPGLSGAMLGNPHDLTLEAWNAFLKILPCSREEQELAVNVSDCSCWPGFAASQRKSRLNFYNSLVV